MSDYKTYTGKYRGCLKRKALGGPHRFEKFYIIENVLDTDGHLVLKQGYIRVSKKTEEAFFKKENNTYITFNGNVKDDNVISFVSMN